MAEIFQEANLLIEKQQYEYAIFLLTDCIKTNNNKPEAFIKRATCFMHMNRYHDAIQDFEQAIKINRTISSAYVKQSKCYVAIGDLQNAINTMTFLSQLEENNLFARCEIEKLMELKEQDKKAQQLFEQKLYDDVINIMNECLEKAKTCIKFKLLKAECLVYSGKHAEALDTVNDILFCNKDDTEAICIRAINLIYQEKYNLGMAELREIMSHAPRAKELYRTYKRIVEQLKIANKEFENNNFTNAEELYREILNLDKKNIKKNKQVLLKLAQIQLRLEEFNKCIDTTCEILDIEPKNIKALEFRAKSNFELQDYELAIEDYKLILTIENNIEFQNNLQIAEQKANSDKDDYKILGISKDTTAKEIKKAFHKLAKIYHPDKGTITSTYAQHKMTVKFAKINNAYQRLMKIYST